MKRIAGVLLGVGLLLTTFVLPATPAHASTCYARYPYVNQGLAGRVIKSNAAVHVGPGYDCGVIAHLPYYASVTYRCWDTSAAGSTWTYVTYNSSGARGWVWDNYLSGLGATWHC